MAGREAEAFSTSKNYSEGDLVLYGGVLFRFTSSHSAGAWTGSDAQAVDNNTENTLTRILSAYSNAQNAIAYAWTVVLEPVNIIGDRYKYVLTNAPDPRQ